MTDIESIVFGKPNSLLCPPASQSNAIQEVPQVLESFAGGDLLREDTFVMGELLGGENQSISTMMESSEHLEGQSIPNESFVHTGLLSANVNDHEVDHLLHKDKTKSSPMSRIFLTRKPRRRERLIPRTGVSVDNNGKFRQLLDVPIHRLLDDLSVSAAAKLVQSDVQPAVADVAGPSDLIATADASLWVDRYRPQRFTDLLGDDRVHREVMAWVKEWDWCVFGRRKARGRKRPRDEDGDNSDEWRRPQEKLLLLSGPPGLGKTTLAHVVAQHAGYSVFEINASDARSADVVDERIRPALESGSAVGSTKPILVVIDEIDGATGGSDNSGGFIHKLIQLTYDKSKKKGECLCPQSFY
ncbi:Chromosome transmission fidelity protein 18 [Grifola frondosa]|uniref:Chromosome transmission fidelity protein 18 n=1 Tax=Grifola frondosa TaxID=5627 RepID=A0A1C7LMG7_GRIFR|nr:Chromosome transmission fidelity protein 18 [Grifola frondosa]